MKRIILAICVFFTLTSTVFGEDQIYKLIVTGDTSIIYNPIEAISQKMLENITTELLKSFNDSGYYYASLDLIEATSTNDRLELLYEFKKGPKLLLNKIQYQGLKRTRANTIERYLNYSDHMVITDDHLNEIKADLDEIEFIDFIPPIVIAPKAGYSSADIVVNFLEKRSATFEGGAGYLPDDEGRFVWYLNLGLNNLFGGGRDFSILSDHREKRRQVLKIDYRMPLFFLRKDYLSVALMTRDYRDQFYEFSSSAAYESKISRQNSLRFEIGWFNVQPEGDLLAYNIFSGGVSFTTGQLTPKVNPKSGLKLTLGVDYRHRRYGSDSNFVDLGGRCFNDSRIKLKGESYLGLSKNLVNYLFLLYNGLETNEELPPFSEMFYVGGPGTLRGFRNEQFNAIKFAVASYEPQIHFDGGYLFGFIDAAYLNNRTLDNDEFYRFGYGFGISLASAQQRLKLSLGWNKDLPVDQPRLSVEFLSSI